jgi:hypothetical protein
MWTFAAVNESTTIKSKIDQFQLQGYAFSLDMSVVHPGVFETIQVLFIDGTVGSVQESLFKNFNIIKIIEFVLSNLKHFFHTIGISWSLDLPMTNAPWVAFENYVGGSGFWIDKSEYLYPDSDFCVFAQYSKLPSVTFLLNSLNLTQCTITIQWLLANYDNQDLTSQFETYPDSKQIYSICLNSTNIDLEQLATSRCQFSHYQEQNKTYIEYQQVEFIFEFIQDLFIFIAIPCACAMGILFNVLIVRAVHQNKEKELKDDFYKFMSLNAVFNCLYCAIFLFYPINSCVNSLSSYFCSLIRTSYATQLFKIVFVAYFGETFKMCANVFYILMNVNRYMLIGREHNFLLESISKWNLKWVVGLTVAFSGLINIGHIFQYQLNGGYYHVFLAKGGDGNIFIIYNSYPLINETLLSNRLYIYFLIYFLLNYVVFGIVSTGVEVTLVRKLHKELCDKKIRLEKMNQTDNLSSLAKKADTPVLSFRKRRKQEIEDRTEQRAVIMVIMNALINIFFRLPEIFLTVTVFDRIFIQNFFIRFFLDTFPSLQDFTTDLTYFCFILTLSTNFFIYYLFNLKFKQTFSSWTHTKKRN